MAGQTYVWVNADGEWLQFGETKASGFGTGHVLYYRWTPNLNEATVAERLPIDCPNLKWREGSPIDEITAKLVAEVEVKRTVKLTITVD